MVEGARLEIVWAGDRLGGSNPLASARTKLKPEGLLFYSDRNREDENRRFDRTTK